MNWYKIFCMSLHYFLVFTTNLFLLHKTTYRHKEVDTSLCELQSLFYILKCLAAPDYHTVDAGGATSGYNGKQILDRFLMIMANMSPSLSHSSSFTYKEQGGRSCAGARVAPAEKFGPGRKFYARTYAILSRIKICRDLRTFLEIFGQKKCLFGSKAVFLG